MINTNNIEAGDKVYLRDGSVIVARYSGGLIYLVGDDINWCWSTHGHRLLRATGEYHPLDIIRIEKAPKPVVETYWIVKCSGFPTQLLTAPPILNHDRIHKITITDGEATIERVK